jgi:hypothetical protein
MLDLNMFTNKPSRFVVNEFVTSIPLVQPKHEQIRVAKRNRQWEKSHRPYRYVNVPLALREQVAALAEHLLVTSDEVARAFIEYGLSCIDAGTLKLRTKPNPFGRKMTLYPRDQARGRQEADGSPKEIPARRKEKSERVKKVRPAVSYRFPSDLHAKLRALAMDLAVPMGEVVAFLLRHGLDAYQAGSLGLNPYPLAVKMTLVAG